MGLVKPTIRFKTDLLIRKFKEAYNISPNVLRIKPSDLAELRESLNLDFLTELNYYKGLEVIVCEDIDMIFIGHEV